MAVIFVFAMHQTALAEAPVIQTKGSVIFLADNLSEKAKLGWCIDTKGRGLTDLLHAHSCKPRGGDTQFSYDVETKMIRSVAYENKCMSLSDPDNAKIPFGLLDCVDGDSTQQFDYDAGSMEIRIAADPTQCIAVAQTISNAGPFQSRDLIFVPCTELDLSFKQWVIRK